MDFIYYFFIAFSLVFVTEFGDKTQLLVLSFTNKCKTASILLGVAIGTFFSHGLAILFGSTMGLINSITFQQLLKLITYISFIFIGLFSLLPKKEKLTIDDSRKDGIMKKISKLNLNYFLLIALCIIVGELGDKTFLSAIGLGVQYPDSKFPLICGAITGMVICNFIALLFGQFLLNYISKEKMQKISGILFLIFGVVGLFF